MYFNTIFLFLLIIRESLTALNNCPMNHVRNIVIRANQQTKDPAIQMQMIRRIIEDIYGGSWGVLIIRNPELVSHDIHWTIPDHTNPDRSPAFCLTVVNRWQYNIFKTGSKDSADRVSVLDVVHRIRQADDKHRPVRLTVEEFDQKLARALELEKTKRSRG
ncbi:unnamed protein product [Auanema sp. JU1783]|nr:unnamed protein product [Auanema sp. JU1783]